MDRKIYYVRASSLSTHVDCPRRWAVEYLSKTGGEKGTDKDEKQVKQYGAVIGDMCHKAVERLLFAKLEGSKVSIDTVVEDQLKDFFAITKITPIKGDDYTDDQIDAGIQIDRMIRLFYEDVLPSIEPYWIEHEIKLEYSHRIHQSVRLDLLASLSPTSFWLIDFKFGRHDSYHAPQLGNDLIAVENELERLEIPGTIDRISVIHIPRVKRKSKQPGAEFIEFTRDQVIDAYEMTMEEIDKNIKDADETGSLWAFRPRPTSNLCSAKTCSAYGTDKCNQWRV